ncbi:MAG: hypothetical protein O2820_25210 [Planctomycetota bacterium]|nr:hypothetical protein [Planctomycetota bacterium]MDA1252514.1 hypothetical protein [Planctomycetota bacterium]
MTCSPYSRREFLGQSALAAGASLASWPHLSVAAQKPKAKRPRVAAIFTVLRFRSHAYNILENFLGPYYFRGKLVDPGVDVVSFYADQFPEDDMAKEASARFGIPLCKSIEEAMCAGGKELAVDAVLSIGEHGNYAYNERGQHLYPRKRFFDESFAVMKKAGRFVPFFNDKHLSYDWSEAKEMYDSCREHGMPLIAGSSVPLAQRRPMLELPPGADIEEAVSIHGGGLESYDFHALEVLQSIVEARRGGETGIARIELVYGEAFEKARKAGRWSQDLVDAAMKAETDMQAARQSRPTQGVFAGPKPTTAVFEPPPGPRGQYAICVKYRDGLKATVLRIGGGSDRWNFACRLKGDPAPKATAYFNSPWGNRGLFKALSHAIQHNFVAGEEPYPAERTLLTTGAVEAVMHSWEQKGNAIETPHLAIKYQPKEWSAFRENGRSWSILTKDVPQPAGFEPRSFDELK